MKRTLVVLLIFAGIVSKAQNIQYSVVSNEPPEIPKLSLNTDLVQIEVIPSSFDASSMNLGVWGHYEIIPNKIGAQFNVRRSIFAFGRLGEKKFPPHLSLELGGYYVLKNDLKNKQTKVLLNREYSGTTYSTNFRGEGTYSYTTTDTYIKIPSDKRIQLLARGGFYLKNNGNNMRFIDDDWVLNGNPEFAKLSSVGVYLGLNLRSLTSIFVDTEEYGVQFASIGKDLYFDVLILPSNTFTDLDGNDITDTVKDYKSGGPVGFKAGYKLFQIDPFEKTGKRFGLCATFEGGMRPYTGFFVNAGIGLTFIKK